MTDETPGIAYKVLTADEMARLEHEDRFDGSADDQRDGFIHLSTADQLEGTLSRHFAGREDLHLVAVDLTALGDSLRWERSRGDAMFPHLYAPLTLDIVAAYSPMERHEDGSIRLPVTG